MDPLLALLVIISVGLALGKVSIRGISIGTSSILFVALLAGHLGIRIPSGLGTLGLALFVYCVGIAAGPTFFRGLASSARVMATLGAVMVASGVAVTWICAKLFSLPADIAAGLMSGALTSTPALGAASEAVAEPEHVAVAFGVAYPFGIAIIVLFVQVMLKQSRASEVAPESDSGNETSPRSQDEPNIQRLVVEIVNPGVVGKRPSEVAASADLPCQISRVYLNQRWRPIPYDYVFAHGDRVVLVGEQEEGQRVAQALGVLCDLQDVVLDGDRERKEVVVTSPEICGRTLKELRLRSRFGVTVTRVRRFDKGFVPSARTRIEFGDTLALVGEPADLLRVLKVVGHRPRTLNETDLLSLAIGLTIGLIVGQVSIELGGVSASLGTAGGPLCVGLILGHFRRIGFVTGTFPPAAQILMTEGGLALFLTDAGVQAGANVWAVLQQQGVVLCVAAIAIATVPLTAGYLMAIHVFGLSKLQSLGAACGGMTSTPGLAALTSSTDSSEPVTSYIAAYPVSLVLITIAAPLLVKLI
ncbi:aspartate:alanine exchanger family transporter [Allorhodopirellula heiligendammensis]|uniref:Aspartate/alanine antiporter n=1 Tax=Allorhodopirellula heiligendammensis TaxID=2714739 RepID=A0A5C6BWB9_9BACT|nr:TrkA C-terminal domain-containing protein [Allorhodopirellula heiligendammensis]TWU16152.1 Aspartate/alanine antiporter [Allorhodopirellula heiligendammensis]